MSPSTIDETEKKPPREIPAFPLQNNKNFPLLCGTGCSCGKETKISKWKTVIMLIVLATVAAALIYRRAL